MRKEKGRGKKGSGRERRVRGFPSPFIFFLSLFLLFFLFSFPLATLSDTLDSKEKEKKFKWMRLNLNWAERSSPARFKSRMSPGARSAMIRIRKWKRERKAFTSAPQPHSRRFQPQRRQRCIAEHFPRDPWIPSDADTLRVDVDQPVRAARWTDGIRERAHARLCHCWLNLQPQHRPSSATAASVGKRPLLRSAAAAAGSTSPLGT